MNWKRRVCTLGALLLCAGVLLAAGAAGDPAARKAPAASGLTEAVLQAAGGVQHSPAQPRYVVSHTADLPEGLSKEGKQESLTEDELIQQKILAESAGKLHVEAPVGLQTIDEIDAAGEKGETRAACLGDKDIDGAGMTAWGYTLNVYYKNRRSTTIYLASEFNCSDGGEISGIRYYVSQVPTLTMPNLRIRLRHTTASAYTTACFDNTGWTTVYGPTDTLISATGWYTFNFSTPFMYDGTSNLEVDVSLGTLPSYHNSGQVYSFTGTGNRSITAQSDTYPNPQDWTCGTGNPTPTLRTGVPRVQFIFPPPTAGACCTGTLCTPDVTEDECVNTLGGIFLGLGTSCDPNPCVGACCYGYPSICVDTDADGCSSLGGAFHPSMECNVTFWCPPPNDNCADVTPVMLDPGVAVVFTGDTRGATNDQGACTFTNPQVWHAITLPGPINSWTLVLDFCGTAPAFSNAYLNWAIGCPCASVTAAATYNTTTCGDTNITMTWMGLPAGTYYYPVLSNPTQAWGEYTINVVANAEYCVPCYTNQTDDWITNVTLNTINNTTGLEPGGCKYGDYTALATDLLRESTYQLSVSFSSGTYTEHVWAWFDWDQDMSFTGPGEAYDLGQGASATLTANITVPAGAVLGATRMRVIERYSVDPTPCGNGVYGETEDYTVVIIEPFGACCLGEDCTITTQAGCAGAWQGAGTDCDPNPCLLPMGACCFADGSCTQAKEPFCFSQGGTSWIEAAPCDPNPCPPPEIACCYADGTCLMMTEADCTTAGGTPQPYPSSCDPTNPCPQPGGNCANPVMATLGLADLPYEQLGKTNCGFVDDYDYPATTHCLYYYDSGEDILYKLVVTEPMNVTLTLDPKTTTWAGFAIGYSCPPMDDCIAAAYSSSATPKVIGAEPNCLHLEPGEYYIMVDTWSTPDCIPDFDLTIEECFVPEGACCVGEVCTIETATACAALTGVYVGDGTTCEPNPCLTGACCFYPSGDCQNLTEEDCTTAGGTFHAGVYCSGIICPTPGDLCTDPNVITALPYAMQFNNDTATAGPPSCNPSYTLTQNDWWFQYTPAVDDECVFVDVYEVTSYDTVMGIYTGPDCDNLTNMICVDDPDGYHLQLALTAGTTYWFQIGDYGSTEGGGVTNFSLYACPTGACCVASTCTIEYPSVCAALGGVYAGDDTTCDPNPCLMGACCLYSPTPECQTTDEAACAALGGFWHVTKDCATYTCPSLGNDCAAPIAVAIPAALPYTDPNQTTCGRVNDYADTCLGSYDGGEDIIYQLVVTEPTCLNITATGNTTSNNWIGVGVDDVCPLGSPCMYAVGVSGTVATLPSVALPPGTYYVIVDTYPAPTCLTDFTLTITASTECLMGACCYATGCANDVFQDVCLAGGGLFLGVGSACSGEDCNGNGIDDACDLLSGVSEDCNGNDVPDECDIASGISHDWDGNGVPDECQPDCNENGYPDFCDLPGGCSIGETEPGVGGCWNAPDCGQSEDCQGEFGNGIPDECELGGKDLRYTYQVDDGVSEDGIGVSAGADLGALVAHEVVSGAGKITSISIAWGGATNGSSATVYVWSDPNQDGSPADALVLGSAATTTQSSGTDTFIQVPLSPPVNVGPAGTKFFVGFIVTSADYAVAIDTTTPILGRNWIVASAYSTPPIDPNDLDYAYNNPLGTLESYGFDGNLMIRAEGGATGADCNNNGIPDDCDIEDGTSLDCNNNGIPDECEVPPIGTGPDCNLNGIPDDCELEENDCNGNNIPDECDIAQGTSEDCQVDGIPDECQLGTGGASVNLVVDPSFEAGVTNPYWVSTSTNYGTVLCDNASCGTGGGTAGPRTGLIWAWFGGCGTSCTLPEIGTLSQAVTIPPGANTLTFWLWNGATGGTSDEFSAMIDGNVVFTILAGDPLYTGGYTQVSADIAAYADGASHLLQFEGIQYGSTATNFCLDDVEIFTQAGASSNDCNENGILDECDIGVEWGGFCMGPDCSTDYNGNGVPDECELCGDFTGAIPGSEPDGAVDSFDYWYIHDAMGYCSPHPKYSLYQLADLDGDGCITFVDYQAWIMCYRMANGKDFVVPKAKLLPKAAPQQMPKGSFGSDSRKIP